MASAGEGALARGAALLARRRRLVEERARRRPLDAGACSALLAELRGRILDLARAEEEAAALKVAVPAGAG